jgi:protein SCO1/2
VDYNVVAVSFDPRETPEMAAAKKRSYMQELGDSAETRSAADGWHFLTAEQEASKLLGKSVGFHFIYDATTNQYVHPSAVMILTPGGRVSRYFYGIDYQPRDIRLGLVESSKGAIGTPVDQVLLYCFHYDPANGKYGLVIMNVLRLGGLLTLAALLGFIVLSVRRDFRAHAARTGVI